MTIRVPIWIRFENRKKINFYDAHCKCVALKLKLCGSENNRWSAWKILPRLVRTMHNYAMNDKWNSHNHPKYFHDILSHILLNTHIYMFDYKANAFHHFFPCLFVLFISLSREHNFFLSLCTYFSFIQSAFRAYPLKGSYSNWWDKSETGKKVNLYIHVYGYVSVDSKREKWW